MSDQGVRPRKLSHWAGLLIVGAAVWHNPGGAAELAITALDKTGSAIGFALNSAGFDGESDYFVEKQPGTGTPGNESGPPVTIATDGDALSPLNGAANEAVVGVVQLHRVVEAVLVEDGATP